LLDYQPSLFIFDKLSQQKKENAYKIAIFWCIDFFSYYISLQY